MKRLTIGVALLCGACGGSPTAPAPPSTPQPPTPPVTPSTFTISGSLTSTNGGSPLTASMDFGVASTTAQNGSFSVTVPVTAPTLALTISGAGLVTRRAYVAPGARNVNLDAIAATAAFDLNFYRQLVRNGFEQPTDLQPLRRLTIAPRVYIRSVDDANRAVDAGSLAAVAGAIRETAPLWSGGAIAVLAVETGTETREGISGWLTIRWKDAATDFCGRSDVGKDGGLIELAPRTPGCSCPGSGVRLRTIRHELGHAFGFWHTGNRDDLLSGVVDARCDQPLSAREIAHAAIAYKRAVGNMDPDQDPSGAVNLAPMRVQ